MFHQGAIRGRVSKALFHNIIRSQGIFMRILYQMLYQKKYLQRHLWKFHQIVQLVNCKYCDKTISEQDLQDHINCHHANKLYVCTLCQGNFTNKRNCGLHKRKVRLVQYCFYPCEIYDIFLS